MSEEELRSKLGYISRTVVEELDKNELFQACVTYPATLANPSIADGSTAQTELPQLKRDGESADHRKVTTTTFFKNRLVAPGGRLYVPNPRCDEEAKLDILIRWHTIEGRPLTLIIEGGKAELYDGAKIVSTVTGVDMSFARMSEYKEADVRRLQQRFTPGHCYSLVDLAVAIAAVKPSDHIAVAAAIAANLYPKLLCIMDKYCDKEPELRVCEALSLVWRSAVPHLQTFMEDAVDTIGSLMASLPDSPHWVALANACLDTPTGSKLIPDTVTVQLADGKEEQSKDMALRREAAVEKLKVKCTAKSGDGSPALKENVAFKCKPNEWKSKLADHLLRQVRVLPDDRIFDRDSRLSFQSTVLDLLTGRISKRGPDDKITRLIRHSIDTVPNEKVPALDGPPFENDAKDGAIDAFCATCPYPEATADVLKLLRMILPLPGTVEAFLNILWVCATGTPHNSKAVFLLASKLADGTLVAGAGKSLLISLFESCLKGLVGVGNAGTFSKPIDGEKHNTLHTLVGIKGAIIDEMGKTAYIDPSAMASLLPAGKPRGLPCRMMQKDTYYRTLDLVIALFASNFEVGADTTDGGGMRRSLWLLLPSVFLCYQSHQQYKEAFLNAMDVALEENKTTTEMRDHVKYVFEKGFHPTRSNLGDSLFNTCTETAVDAIKFQDRREAARAALASGGYVFKEDKTLDKRSSPLDADEDHFHRMGRALLHVVLAFGLHNLKDHDKSDPWLKPPPSSDEIKKKRYLAKKTQRALTATSAHATPEELKQEHENAIYEKLWVHFVNAHDYHDALSMDTHLPPIGNDQLNSDDFLPYDMKIQHTLQPDAQPSHVDGRPVQKAKICTKHTVLRAMHTWLQGADAELFETLKLKTGEKCRLAPLKDALRKAFKWAQEQAGLSADDAKSYKWPDKHPSLVFSWPADKVRRKVDGCEKDHADVLYNWSPKAEGAGGYNQQSYLPV